jgi:hypothetical protein
VKNLLSRSFPNSGDEAKVTEMFVASVAADRLGIPVCRDEDRLEYAYRWRSSPRGGTRRK